jgi:hypothetical protein
MIVPFAPVFPSNNALSKAQLASSSSGLTPQDRIKSTKIGDTESISLRAQTETLTTLLELEAATHRSARVVTKRRRRGLPTMLKLSVPALHLPTPRATGRVE